MSRVGWLDTACGASGDMLLGALLGAGVPLAVLTGAVDALDIGVQLRAETVLRAGLSATLVHVDRPEGDQPHRTWGEVRTLIENAPLDPEVARRSLLVFGTLATAEGLVHGIEPAAVTFHEVGAWDSLADVVGCCAGLAHLGLSALHAAPLALGGGGVSTEHGDLPVPVPAVVEVLRLAAAPSYGGPLDVELTTPTGAALLGVHVQTYGYQPAMTVTAHGTGAGSRDLPNRPNVLRLLIGETTELAAPRLILVEANIDDLDPRLWPGVLAALLAAGAIDAWLTPILMKKGRPAHTVAVLTALGELAAVERAFFTETTTIGVRRTAIDGRTELNRRTETIDVYGHQVRVKVAELDGIVVSATPEWVDVAAAAAALGKPAKQVLAAASAAASAQLPGGSPLELSPGRSS